MLSNIEKSLLNTIAYYNELDYPMTAFEVWKHLAVINEQNASEQEKLSKLSLADIIKALESEELRKYIEESRGFYFLKGRKDLVNLRLGRSKISSQKLKKLRKIVWLLRLVPFVRMVGATGRIAMKNAERNSDWDLFVICKKGKIWTGRTLITALVHALGKRRYGDRIKDRICLNYFITDESLKINIENRLFEINLFSASEYSFMIPLFGFKKYRKFQIRNSWIRDFNPNYTLTEAKNAGVVPDTHFSKTVRKCGEKLLGFDFIENFLRKFETERIAKNPKTHISGSIIEANDEALVFLPEPQGKEIYDKTVAKLEKLSAIRTVAHPTVK
ncbi:MAG: hypothetical protein V1804_00440 [Patescibacteria group bacterium]